MKGGLKEIIGKTITSVVVGSNKTDPQNQVFLIFSDGTRFEFWGPQFSCAGGVDSGGVSEAIHHIEVSMGGTVTNVYPKGQLGLGISP